MTAVKLGKTVKVSESTVVRFAAKLGYDGYPEMQKALQEMIRNSLTSVQRIDAAKETISDRNILERVLHINIDEIRSTLESSSPEAFNACVEIIAERKWISFWVCASYCRGLSNYYLNSFQDVFLLTTSAAKIHGRLICLKPDDVMIRPAIPPFKT